MVLEAIKRQDVGIIKSSIKNRMRARTVREANLYRIFVPEDVYGEWMRT
ncbi:MAG: hypothetical protein JSW19_02665 [Candidatus Bathyarchaeota archaeon]|nr:MAG: hypothetical protein JSW19_02665 [Candidatus Bathyarchaeota archaeon]